MRHDTPVEKLSLSDLAGEHAELAREYLRLLLAAKRKDAADLVVKAVEQGVPVKDVYLRVFQPVLYEIGHLWQHNVVSVAQEHYCTAATQFTMSLLYQHIFTGKKTGRCFVGCCVGGELHEIGMRMVTDFFEMEGWDTYYMGASTPDEDVIRTIIDQKANVVGISVTMTFHLHLVGRLILRIRSRQECRNVKIMVGGYPFLANHQLWRGVGAHAFATDASQAIEVAGFLLEDGRRS
ncbi:cobalamin B12-binding domain-containing protein [Desulfonatronum thioautotrophicum]|uniref:cobalamin B12-binding domain-containing protein n=1 Tax=Desulfonatronum thioautotrophicum TaxID=617001 RepID=UPI00069A6972|nr:cobalamin-dependent protein [Desulfonatronum thioautotrophicum]